MLGRCPLGLPTLRFANTGQEGLEGSTGSAPKLGPEACYREEFETAAAAGLINHSEPLSTSEVGLNFWPRRGQHMSFGPGWLHQPGLKGCIGPGWCHEPVPIHPL